MDGGGIAPRDQLALLNMLELQRLEPGMAVAVRRADPAWFSLAVTTHHVPVLAVDSRFSVKEMKLSELGVATQRVPLLPAVRMHNSLQPALSQRIGRDRLDMDLLGLEARRLLDSALEKRYGAAEWQAAEVLGLFPEIPPEAAKSVRLAADLSRVSFDPSAATGELRGGFWLVVVKSPAGKTDRFLLRLE